MPAAAPLALSILLAGLALEPSDPVETVDDGIARLEAAWRTGDLHEVSHVAADTLRLIEADACPWRADAARVAFMGMIAGAQEGPSLTGYSAWVADRVANAIGGALPAALRDIVADAKAEPGEHVTMDHLYAASPYLGAPGDTGCAPARLNAERLSAEPDNPSSAIVVLRLGPGYESATARLQLAYAYPPSEGEAILARLREGARILRLEGPIQIIALDPCTRVPVGTAEYFRFCRPGFE